MAFPISCLSTFLITILAGYFFSDYIIVKKAKKYHYLGVRRKLHVHHSSYGLLAFAVAPFVHSIYQVIFLIGFGIGIIAEHTYHESFVFIEKNKTS